MGTILTLINFVMLLFWIRLWADPKREFYFNPFLSGPVRFVDSVTSAMGLPVRLACLLILIVGIALRGAIAYHYGHMWQISLGSVFFFRPTAMTVQQLLTFSMLDFFLFVVRLWTAYILIRVITPPSHHSRAAEAFHFAVRPFSLMAPLPRLALLALFHLLIVFELMHSASLTTLSSAAKQGVLPQMPPTGLPDAIINFLRLGWMAAASFADGLNAMRVSLMVFVFGGLLATIVRNQLLRQICYEALNVVMGRFARVPFAAGMIDFTPLVFFFALQIIYSVASSLLLALTAMIN